MLHVMTDEPIIDLKCGGVSHAWGSTPSKVYISVVSSQLSLGSILADPKFHISRHQDEVQAGLWSNRGNQLYSP